MSALEQGYYYDPGMEAIHRRMALEAELGRISVEFNKADQTFRLACQQRVANGPEATSPDIDAQGLSLLYQERQGIIAAILRADEDLRAMGIQKTTAMVPEKASPELTLKEEAPVAPQLQLIIGGEA